jgi:four helix bundle protein
VGNDFRLLDLAEQVADEIQQLLDNARPRLLHHGQLERSGESIPSNIREGYGRREGPDRNQYLRVSRGSAAESDRHLRANYKSGRISEPTYWRLHHRLIVIQKMITKIIGD